MSTKPSPLKRAMSAVKKSMGPQQYGLRGKPFVCQLCGHDQFTTKTDSSLVGSHILVGLYALACADCGHVEFFAKLPPVL
jgi:hypothetical protein